MELGSKGEQRIKGRRKKAGGIKHNRFLLALLLCAVMAVASAGCGRQDGAVLEQGSGSAQDVSQNGGESGQDAVETERDAKAMGRYMESAVELPEGANVIGRTMRVQEDGTYLYFDAGVGLYGSSDEGALWEKKADPKTMFGDYADLYLSRAAISPDGKVACCADDYQNMEEPKHTLVIGEAGGVILTADGSFTDGDWLCGLQYAPDGRLYAFTLKGKVCRLEESGEIKQLFTAIDEPETMAFLGKSLLVLHRYGVEIYDLEQGALQDADEVLNDYVRENMASRMGASSDAIGGDLIAEKEGILYLAYRGGVYRHVLYGGTIEQVIDGQYSSFGDPTKGISKTFLLPNGEFLLMPTGEELIRFTYDPDEPTLPEKQLKLYSLFENSRLRQVISAYQKAYPEVYISYEVGMPDNSAVTRTDALKNLNVKLLAKEGPDVILMDGIDAGNYIESGMLYDMTGLLDGIEKGELYEKIAGAYRTDAGTFLIPTNFRLPVLFGKKEDIEKITDLKTLADAVERLSATVEKGTTTGIMTAGRQLSQLTLVCSQDWMTGRTLNEEAIEEFLTQARRIYQADMRTMSQEERDAWVGGNTYEGYTSVGGPIIFNKFGFAKLAYGPTETVVNDLGAIGYLYDDSEEYEFKLWKGQGEAGFLPMDQIAIAAGTQQADLAENFVRMMLSKEVQEVNLGSGFPVHRAAMDALIEKQAEYSVGGSWGDMGIDFSHGGPGAKTEARFKELVETAEHPIEGNAFLEETVQNYGSMVLTGSLDPAEAMDLIRKEMSIYLAE